MIYELRTYTFHQGKAAAYVDLVQNVGRPVRGDDYGKCHGYWVHEFGQLNQVSHLWSYASLDERARQREALSKNERWTRDFTAHVRPLLQRQDIRLLNPVSELKPPEQSGGVYELRTYRTQPGDAPGLCAVAEIVFSGAREILAECGAMDRRGAATKRAGASVELPRPQPARQGTCRRR